MTGHIYKHIIAFRMHRCGVDCFGDCRLIPLPSLWYDLEIGNCSIQLTFGINNHQFAEWESDLTWPKYVINDLLVTIQSNFIWSYPVQKHNFPNSKACNFLWRKNSKDGTNIVSFCFVTLSVYLWIAAHLLQNKLIRTSS